MNNDVVYFSVNDWSIEKDYPNSENFQKWLVDEPDKYFQNKDWVKNNKLCMVWEVIDMSCNYTISAPLEWVKENCPEILGSGFQYFPGEGKTYPEYDLWSTPFLEYSEENIGAHYFDSKFTISDAE